MDDLFYHSTEWEPIGVVTVDDFFLPFTEWEPSGVVTVNDLFYHSMEWETTGLTTVDDFKFIIYFMFDLFCGPISASPQVSTGKPLA